MSLEITPSAYFNNNYHVINNSSMNFLDLPEEIIRHIAYFCGHKGAIYLGLVNRSCRFLISDGVLWNLFLRKDFPTKALKVNVKTSPALYRQQLIGTRNMKTGKYNSQVLKDGAPVSKVLVYGDNVISSSSFGRRINIWDLKAGELVQSLCGHEDSINCVAICGDNIISSSPDYKINFWDPKTGKILRTFDADRKALNCMTVYDNKLIVDGPDSTIKILDFEGQELQTLSGHQGRVDCMTICGRNLATSSWDEKVIKIWDLESGEERHTINLDHEGITCMTANDGNIISGSKHGIIEVWDLNTGEKLKTFEGEHQGIRCIEVYFDKVISGGDDDMKIWDIKTGKILKTIDEHESRITSLVAEDGRIISGSLDCTILVRDYIFSQRASKKEAVVDQKTEELSRNHFPILPKELLEDNLKILGEMAHANHIQKHKDVEALAEMLHPDVKERIKHHAIKLGVQFPAFAKFVILNVQTEICVETLYNAVHHENHDRVSQLLLQLEHIDSQNTKLYELLWESCGRPDWRWGEYAFHNQHGCSATILQKKQAIIEFKRVLKERWG